jgi:hypothetical protein
MGFLSDYYYHSYSLFSKTPPITPAQKTETRAETCYSEIS